MRGFLTMGIVLLVAACASTHESERLPIAEQVALFDELVRVECERTLACASWREGDGWPCSPRTAGLRREEIRAGRAHVDAEAARRCVDAIEALGDCTVRSAVIVDPARDLEATCRDAFVVDRIACGETTCARDESCILSRDCSRHCEPGPFSGVACDPIRPSCPFGSTCIDRICTASTGVECQGGGLAPINCIHYRSLGSPCEASGGCGPLAYCAEDALVCTEGRLAEEAPCAVDADPPCADGLVCDAATLRCLPYGTVEGFCHSASECGGRAYCSATGECMAEPEGAICTSRSVDLHWLDSCPDGFLCAPDERCHRPLALGDACDASSACPLGSLCSSGRCAPVVDDGEPCDATVACRARRWCIDGACVFASAPGELNGLCLDGACVSGHCVDGFCRRYLPYGAACASVDDCPTCDAGICQPLPIAERGERCWGMPVSCAAGLVCRTSVPLVEPAFCCE